MSTTNEEKQYLHKICQGILDNSIASMEDLQKNIAKKKIENDFLKKLLDELIDSFEHMPRRNAKEVSEPFESLNIYLISNLLRYDVDMISLEKAYKDILTIKQLDRKVIDGKLEELLQN